MDFSISGLRPLAIAGALAAATLIGVNQANATLILTVQSGATSITVTDNGVGDLDPTSGVLAFMGSVGNFTTNVSVGLGIGGSPAPQIMDLLGLQVSSATGGTITLTLEEDGYIPSQAMTTFVSEIGGTVGAGGTLTATSLLDTTSTTGNLGTAWATHGPFGPGAFADSQVDTLATPGAFGQAIQIVVTHAGAAATSYDHQIRIAEPATLGLFGLGLAGIGAIIRRRRKR